MALIIKRLLGGIAHGERIPEWFLDDIGEWDRAGVGANVYELRRYQVDGVEYGVWADVAMGNAISEASALWFVRANADNAIDSQKEMLKESMAATEKYTQVVTAVGYAALFALFTQMADKVGTKTALAIAILLMVSVLCFVGIELFGMIVRSHSMKSVQRIVDGDPEQFFPAMERSRRQLATLMTRAMPYQFVVMYTAVACGLGSFVLMASAFVHGFARQMIG
ncbi:hypothetical protein ACF3M1_01285 [Luteimonas sp. WGS1318]|uniref:hypothetical protein n=1 Tax=Luteimonas sp. WGS1318 TaxID=3366815 RepID=UPI00372D673C